MKIWVVFLLLTAGIVAQLTCKAEVSFGVEDLDNSSLINTQTVQYPDTFWIPDSFTPDKDGINEVFKPVINPNYPFEDYSFTIYDRMGRKIFESTEPSASWNGTNQSESGNYFLHNEVFIWRIKLTFEGEDSPTEKVGLVTLIR